MVSTSVNVPVVRLFGASVYFGVLIFAFLLAGDWGQSFLFLVSVAAGLVSGRWWSVALGAVVVPTAALTFVVSDEYGGDSASGPFDAALLAALFFALPLAVAIAIGVGLRRLATRRRSRAVAGSI